MRFAAAIAILAQGLVSANEPSSPRTLISQQLTKKHRVAVGRVSGSAQSFRSRDLRQSSPLDAIEHKLADLRTQRRCNPHHPDVGILGECRPGESCTDSGVCVPSGMMFRKADTNDTTITPINDDPLDVLDDLEDDLEELLSEFNYYNLLCNSSSPIYGFFALEGTSSKCDCSKLNVVKKIGMVNCSNSLVCEGDVCYETKFAVGFDGDFDESAFAYKCLNFTKPYEQEICYYYGYNKLNPYECVIGVDGVDCKSCTLVENTDGDAGDLQCTLFDCTNIANGNAGSTCEEDRPVDIFEKMPQLYPVEATVSFLEMIILGIARMSVEEQIEWATLTAEYIVQYYDTIAQDILRDLIVVIEVLAVLPGKGSAGLARRLDEAVDLVKVIYNTDLKYRIEDPSLISPEEVAQLPFFTEEDKDNYVLFINKFGSGNLANITDIEFLGPRDPIRPGKSGKKSKKSSKKASKSDKGSKSPKSMKSEKSSKKSSKKSSSTDEEVLLEDEREPLFVLPTMEEITETVEESTKSSKKEKSESSSESETEISYSTKSGKKRRQ